MPKAPTVHKPFNEYLLKLAEDHAKISRTAELLRTQKAVTLIRRFRGNSPSDSLGYFSSNPGSTAWLGDASGSMSFANLHPINIVKPAVTIYMSAMITARVQLKIDAANKNPTLGGAANIARGLFEFMDNREGYWDEQLEAQIGAMVQLHYGTFLRSDDQGTDTVMEEEWGSENVPDPGEYVCGSCGAEGPYIPEEGQESVSQGQVPCPQCGKSAELSKEPGTAPMEVPKGAKKKKIGSPRTTVVSPFQIRLDERRSMGGNLKKAEWFDYGEWLNESEMDDQFPGFEYGKPMDGSFPMRWKYRLETGVDIFTRRDANDLEKKWEVRNRWIRPEYYQNYVSPSTYQMKDGRGQVIFEIGQGEKLIDVCPDGFLYKVVGGDGTQGSQGTLLPFFEESDFRKQWVYLYFTPDPFSFWGQPKIELISLNDDATDMNTLDMESRLRNSQVSVVFNDQAFDEDSFENDLIPTKAGFDLGDNPPDHYFSTFSMPPMREAMEGLKMQLEIGPMIGASPTNAAIGAPQAGEPYAAQLLQKQSSLGQLSPSQQSKARGKKEWFIQQAQIIQDSWPPAKFEYLRTRLGEEWKQEDIEAFMNCDIRRDIEVDYVSGSEVPTSQIERQLNLNNIVQQLPALAPLFGDQGALPMDAMTKVVSDWAKSNGVDVDINNTEGEERLCTSRLETIKRGMKELGGKYPPDQLVAIIMQHPQLHVMPGEDQKVAIEFYTDQQIAAMTEEEPDQVYVAILASMIQKHQQAGQAKQQEELAANPELQAQMAQAEQAKQAQQMQMEAQDQQDQTKAALDVHKTETQAQIAQTKAQAESERTQADLAESENERQHELEREHLQRMHESSEAERQHERAKELAEIAAKNKPKEKAAA